MRKIALVTTSRADYGIQSRLVKMLQGDIDIDFSLVVSGTHLSEKHGLTIREIEGDGIRIAAKVDLRIDDDPHPATIMARAIPLFESALTALKPDICILLGDRYEMLAASLACTFNNIPIAHIHGGETSEGAIDEVFRHSITKAAYLHFTSCETYRRRVIQMGEDPARVFNVGSLGVENILDMDFISREALALDLGIVFSKRNFLVTFHPVTSERGLVTRQLDELLSALSVQGNATIIFTHPNADAEGDAIASKIADYVAVHHRSYLFKSLGAKRYLSLAKCMDAVVGNSSSGIIEVPSLKVPTVNVGDRQMGRVTPVSVINCLPRKDSIVSALETVLSDDFRNNLAKVDNPYEKSGTATAIVTVIKGAIIAKAYKKRFYNLWNQNLTT